MVELETLISIADKFPWAKARTVMGTCEFVPGALRGIISENKEERKAAYWEFDNNVVVQGGLFSGAFFILPFLLGIFRNSSIRSGNKRELVDLIFEIANGASVEIISFETKIEGQMRYVFPNHSSEFLRLPLQIACRNLALEHIQYFLQETSDTTSEIRLQCFELALSFREHEFLIREFISKIIADEKDESLLKMMQDAIEEFNDDSAL